jgi:hypothetical protein
MYELSELSKLSAELSAELSAIISTLLSTDSTASKSNPKHTTANVYTIGSEWGLILLC